MKTAVIVRPEAERDIDDAYIWYEERRPGLGAEFLLCVEEGFAKIQRHPEMYPIVHKNLRRILIRRFPYGIFYLSDQTSVIVLSVSHAHRDPQTWRSRV
jgi:plasmid stabilization system protein ParE